jgi:signal transduction histidine kinase
MSLTARQPGTPASSSRTGLRLFLSAWFLALSASLIILPAAALSATSEFQVWRGVIAALTGLALLWLGLFPQHGRGVLAAHFALALGQIVLFAERLATGSINGALVQLLLGFGILIVGAPVSALPERLRARESQLDWLNLVVAPTAIVLGLAIAIRIDPLWTVFEGTGISSVAYGLALVAASSLVVVQATRRRTPRGAAMAPGIVAGLLLLGIPLLASRAVESLYLFVSTPLYLRASVMMVPQAWHAAGGRFDWHSLGSQFGVTAITIAAVPLLFVSGVLAQSLPVDEHGLAIRQMTAAIVTIALLAAMVAGLVVGARQARGSRRLAAAIAGIARGRRSAPDDLESTELSMVGRAVAAMAMTMDEQRTETSRRLEQAVLVERALSSSLDVRIAFERFLAALVPSFSDIAAVYVRHGLEVERLLLEGPDAVMQMGRFALRQDATMGPDAVLRNGVAVRYLSGLPDEYLRAVAMDRDHLAQLRNLDLGAVLIEPVRSASGEILAAVAAANVGTRAFSEVDAASLADYATRAGLTIDNAGRYSELLQTNEALETANAVKDEFLGLISHELKTPITTILGNAAILARDGGSVDRRGAIADVLAESERLAGIVDNMMTLARLEVGRPATTEPVYLERVARLVTRRMERQAGDRAFTISSDPGLIIEASAEHLEMILLNLLTNAVKYSTPATAIDIAIRQRGRRAVVSVADHGNGLNDDEAERAFETFYRSPRNQSGVPGLGIGLSVCRRLVEALGGQIWAGRRADGDGSVFAFWLPLAATDEDGSSGAAAPLTSQELRELLADLKVDEATLAEV